LIYGDFSTGRVGIGTIIPGSKLEVVQTNWADIVKVGQSSTSNRLILSSGSAYASLSGGTTNNNHIVIYHSTGNVGIGTYSVGSYKLYVNGTAYSTGGWQSSDLRFKKNIEMIDSPIDKIMNIKGVSFEWKTSEYKDRGLPEGRHYGVIAQEVEKVLPEIIKEGPDGEKAVSYTELVPILTEAIKQQQKQIEAQQKQIEALLGRVNALEQAKAVNPLADRREDRL